MTGCIFLRGVVLKRLRLVRMERSEQYSSLYTAHRALAVGSCPREKSFCPREKYRLSGPSAAAQSSIFCTWCCTCAMPGVVLGSTSAWSSRRSSLGGCNDLEDSKNRRSAGGHGNQHVRLRGAQIDRIETICPARSAICASSRGRRPPRDFKTIPARLVRRNICLSRRSVEGLAPCGKRKLEKYSQGMLSTVAKEIESRGVRPVVLSLL